MIRLDEERIEYENVVVVLGHGDDVTLRGDLEATATGDLDVRTDEVRQKLSAAIKDGNVELVPVRVADQDVAVVRHVNAVREEGDVLSRDPAHRLTTKVDNYNCVSLEVANVKVVIVDDNVRGFGHGVCDVQVFDGNSVVRIDDENGRTNRIHNDDFSVRCRGKSGNNVHKLDFDLLDEPSVIVKNLHPGPIPSTVANDEESVVTEDSDLARIPKVADLFPRIAEMSNEVSLFVEYLDQMMVGVGNDDFFASANGESMGGIQIRWPMAELAERNTNVHSISTGVRWGWAHSQTSVSGEVETRILTESKPSSRLL